MFSSSFAGGGSGNRLRFCRARSTISASIACPSGDLAHAFPITALLCGVNDISCAGGAVSLTMYPVSRPRLFRPVLTKFGFRLRFCRCFPMTYPSASLFWGSRPFAPRSLFSAALLLAETTFIRVGGGRVVDRSLTDIVFLLATCVVAIFIKSECITIF